MGLYLCIFEDDEDIDGVGVGPYSDFASVRECVAEELEEGMVGSKFPTFMLHSDCDGEWSVSECEQLKNELETIIEELKGLPPRPFCSEWQEQVARSAGFQPQNAFESFIDVDGEPVLERIYGLTLLAIEKRLPILFQ